MKKFLLSFLLTFMLNILFAQQYNIYQQDFIELNQLINDSYPLSDSIKNKMLSVKQKYLSDLEACSDEDFFRIKIQSYLALLNDGHSKIDCYTPFTRKGHHPIRFNFINEDLFISSYPNTIPSTFIGKQVITINGVDIKTISRKAKKYISADNDVDLRNYLRWLLNQPTFYDHIGIDADTELLLELKDGSKISWIRDLNTREFYVKYNDNKYNIDILKLVYYKNKENELTGWSNELFEYEILEEHNACYFKFQECLDVQWVNANPDAFKPFPKWLLKFLWRFRGGDFSHFCKKMFDKIEKNEIDNLIIDLRMNKGGTSILGYQLLEYLADIESVKDYTETFVVSKLLKENYADYFNKVIEDEGLQEDTLPILIKPDNENEINKILRDKKSHYYQKKPKNQFKGNVYIMVGNRTFSSAANIAVLFADNNLAVIVGNPMGYGASSNGEMLNFTLSNTDVKGTMSCKAFYRPAMENKSKELGIDINLTNTQLDKFHGIDKEFKELLEIIQKQ
jgi:hypothetical protein